MGRLRGYLLLAAPLACGPVGKSDDDSTSTTATATSATTTTAPAPDPTTTGDPTSSTADPTATSSTSTTTTAATSSSTGPATTTGEATTGTTGEPTEPHLRAYRYAGGYDRLIVQRIDPIAPRCTAISFVLADKMSPPEYAITAPPMWSVERVHISQDLTDCEGWALLPPELDSLSGTGSVGWGEDYFAKIVDIDVTLSFAQDEPWKPAEEHLFAVGLVTDNEK